MPPRLVTDQDLMDRLATLFRSSSFEGATLTDIAQASGLQRSSLYHRFPGGKQQMAAEVARAVVGHFVADVLRPLAADEPVEQRIRRAGTGLRRFYADGSESCLIEMLSIGDPGPAAREIVVAAATAWINAFADLARGAGAPRREALARAQDAVASIQGALVLARVLGDTAAFDRAIDRLPATLLGVRR